MSSTKYNKLPSEHAIEELLEAIESSDEVIIADPASPNDVFGFFSAMNIQQGPNKVRSKLLYQVYRAWTKTPVTKQIFYNELSAYLQPMHHGLYGINESALNLSKRGYKLLASRMRDKTKSKQWKRHYEGFIANYSIKEGTTWVKANVLFYLYDLWSYSKHKKNLLGPVQFNNMSRMFFPCRTRNEETRREEVWFQMDIDLAKFMPEEHLQQIEEGRKRSYEKRSKKEKS